LREEGDATSTHDNTTDSSKRRKLKQLKWEGECWPNLDRERRGVEFKTLSERNVKRK